MNAERLQALCETMHLTVRGLARFAGRSETRIREMHNGKTPIPAPLSQWFESLERWLANHPPPPPSK